MRTLRVVFLLLTLIGAQQIFAQNLLANPNFDTSLDGWFLTSPLVGQAVTGTASWQPLDALRSGSSGSVVLKKTLAGTADATFAQCVAVDPGKTYDVSARILIPAGQTLSSTAKASVSVGFYQSDNCFGSGLLIGGNTTYLTETYSGAGDFHMLSHDVDTAPANAKSARVELRTTDPQNSSAQIVAYFDSIVFAPSGGCLPNSVVGVAALCLDGGRFKVVATYATTGGASLTRATGIQLTPDSGYFWFFNPENAEVTIKVLNACVVNNRHWVFAAGMTNVNVVLTVTDTRTGAVKTFTNPLNTPFAPIQNTDAFACP